MLRNCCLASCLAAALSYPSFVPLNPNGNNVTGVNAIGHVNIGGGGPRNAFGIDFAKLTATNGWNQALCVADSDGDGQTNGLELGDPCCVWTPGTTPQFLNDISHPGNASWTTSRSCSNITCSNGVNPCVSAPAAGNDGPNLAVPLGSAGGALAGIACIGWLACRKRKPTPESSGDEQYEPLAVSTA